MCTYFHSDASLSAPCSVRAPPDDGSDHREGPEAVESDLVERGLLVVGELDRELLRSGDDSIIRVKLLVAANYPWLRDSLSEHLRVWTSEVGLESA